MLIGLVLLAGLASVPLCGGRLGALADVRFRHARVVVAGIALQVLIIDVLPSGSVEVHRGLHLASYALVGFFVASNARLPGVALAGLGGALNLAAIAANHGVMPADPGAVRSAGLEYTPGHFINSVVVAHPKLAFLGDVFAVPASLPFHNVFSVGDIVIGAGAVLFLHGASGSRLVRRRGRTRVDVEAFALVRATAASSLLRLSGRCTPPGPPVAGLALGDGRTLTPLQYTVRDGRLTLAFRLEADVEPGACALLLADGSRRPLGVPASDAAAPRLGAARRAPDLRLVA